MKIPESLMERDYRRVRNAALWVLVPGWLQQLIYIIVGIPFMIFGTAAWIWGFYTEKLIDGGYYFEYSGEMKWVPVPTLEWITFIVLGILILATWISLINVFYQTFKARRRGVTWSQLAVAADEASGSPTVEKAIDFALEFDKARREQINMERAARPQRVI
jgi:hypothetical protein